MPDSHELCEFHMTIASSLESIVSDMKWFLRVGKWGLSVVGFGIALLIPMVATFLVHISSLNAELVAIKNRDSVQNERIVELSKKIDLLTQQIGGRP